MAFRGDERIFRRRRGATRPRRPFAHRNPTRPRVGAALRPSVVRREKLGPAAMVPRVAVLPDRAGGAPARRETVRMTGSLQKRAMGACWRMRLDVTNKTPERPILIRTFFFYFAHSVVVGHGPWFVFARCSVQSRCRGHLSRRRNLSREGPVRLTQPPREIHIVKSTSPSANRIGFRTGGPHSVDSLVRRFRTQDKGTTRR